MTPDSSPAFTERDFELLAAALERVDASRRELFLTKLVILLTANSEDKNALAANIARAEAHLNLSN